MEQPLVSVICLCYNHARFVAEAIHSVLNQTHTAIELIVVDDASVDGSQEVIARTISDHTQISFIRLEQNVGNCRAFNRGLKEAKGQYIIDLAADDVLLPQRVAEGVAAFEKYGTDYGIQFSDAMLIDEWGNPLGKHSDRFPHASIPMGDIYKEVVHRYFICSPTMMARRDLMDQLGGYDETLAYEDFDFWVRASRITQGIYIPHALIKRRLLPSSMRTRQFTFRSRQLHSTWAVCNKIMHLNRAREEDEALAQRLLYEMKVALRLFNFYLCYQYAKLWLRAKVH